MSKDLKGQMWFPGFWRPMRTAPRDATWFLGLLKDGTELRVHYACGDDGEQPPFDGFFKQVGKAPYHSYYQVDGLVAWRPE